ncbi:DNA-binding transcriptional regulator, MurR/RpiR family, contains HTH and SIS domains [Saccharopolyspora kobensis]|uniref:DNA-binding transcriptional regulator, MurR/RpiR family, contains HTH and SIS domains n=1 Tax=Saccharopolyspora kobensis TaxID=146035 RepID=A0A1H5X1N2_9PSEU|nr:SIS domain-containing protein [Saccharopolyspora kobensis]SEG05681.1 DNA-binding transcriptional regulator, MurR/RpiR family, contains HTH and SIS domains [Saccharopolyspora kobensis]SFD81811.1 DNA-binding transcriptional regulator, MurR/RpiR family, contains HTH and SIS domains [Saccharopolyspora kobensis]
MTAHDTNRDLTSPRQRFDARVQRRSAAVLQQRIAEQEIRSLDAAMESIARDGSVERAAALVVRARRRFILGAGKSFAYACLLAADLGASLSNVTTIDGRIVQAVDVLTEVRSSDALVVFSLRRYRRESIEVARQFAASGGTLVVVTDAEDAPLAAVADAVIVVQTESASYSDSPTAVAAVSHVLATLITASAKGAQRRFGERDRFSRALGIYADEADNPRSET